MNHKNSKSLNNDDSAEHEAKMLPSGAPELIKEIAKAMTKNSGRVEMRFDIKDENGKFVDNFITDVAPVVGDFVELEVRDEKTSYEVISRRLLLQHFDNVSTNEFTSVRSFEIIVRKIS